MKRRKSEKEQKKLADDARLVRVHRGNRVSVAFERNLRTIIRKHLRAGMTL